MQQQDPKSKFLTFQQEISHIVLPSQFNYPFYYEPHPLCIIAADELKEYLLNQTDFEHNFGLDSKTVEISINAYKRSIIEYGFLFEI